MINVCFKSYFFYKNPNDPFCKKETLHVNGLTHSCLKIPHKNSILVLLSYFLKTFENNE